MDPIWLIYLAILVGPFVQEDAAVIGAATYSAANPEQFPLAFFVILIGLIASDIWKYWIGYAGHRSARLRAMAENDRVASFRDKVSRNLVLTLMGVRFLPLARVPAYIACGYFKVSYAKFCAIIAMTAFLYVCVIFAFCHLLGEVFGDKLEWILGSLASAMIAIAVFTFGWRWWAKKP